MKRTHSLIWVAALTMTAASLGAQSRQTEEALRWTGSIAIGETLWIRNLNGGIEVEPARGNEVEIVAEKRWREGDPDAVEAVIVQHGNTLTVCALWEADERECGPEGEYRHDDVDKEAGRVSVHFTIRLPDGVALDASTVNGGLRIEDVSAAVRAHSTNGSVNVSSTRGRVDAQTTNGRVEVHAASGEVTARTTNGSLVITLDEMPRDDLVFRTTNGSVTLTLPAGLNAELDASVTNGSIDSDYQILVQGRMSRRHLRGTIGDGGPTIELGTTNGSIEIRRKS